MHANLYQGVQQKIHWAVWKTTTTKQFERRSAQKTSKQSHRKPSTQEEEGMLYAYMFRGSSSSVGKSIRIERVLNPRIFHSLRSTLIIIIVLNSLADTSRAVEEEPGFEGQRQSDP